MTQQEDLQKTTVSVSLPRSFYKFFFSHHLFEEYSSFTDWVRDCVRKSRDHWRVQRSIQKGWKTNGERIENEFGSG